MSKYIRDNQWESYSKEDDYVPKKGKKVKKFKDKEDKQYKKK